MAEKELQDIGTHLEITEGEQDDEAQTESPYNQLDDNETHPETLEIELHDGRSYSESAENWRDDPVPQSESRENELHDSKSHPRTLKKTLRNTGFESRQQTTPSAIRRRREIHNRPDALMQSEGGGTGPCCVSRVNFPPIQDPLLENLALALMGLDLACFKLVIIAAGATGKHYNQLQDILDQFHEVRMGRQQLTQSYLEDLHVIEYWRLAEKTYHRHGLKSTFGPHTQEVLISDEGVNELGHYATEVANAILEAVEKDQLSREREAVIRERWSILDTFFDDIISARKTAPSNPYPTWSYLVKRMEEKAADKRRLVFHSIPTVMKSSQGIQKTSALLWFTFAVTVGVAMPLVAQGFLCSPHQHGTVADADFWFLIQNSSMSVLGILTMAKPFRKRQIFWMWGPMAAAVVCAVLAPVFYLRIPTEWSALMSVFAGAIQAFVTLQIALLADEGNISEHAKSE